MSKGYVLYSVIVEYILLNVYHNFAMAAHSVPNFRNMSIPVYDMACEVETKSFSDFTAYVCPFL